MLEEWRATVPGGPTDRPVTLPGKPAALAGAEEVTYETTFADPRAPGDAVAVVVLRGLYAHAELDVSADRLDGEGPVRSDAYFAPVRVPVRPDGETTLSVTCRAPRDRFGGLYDTDRVPESERVPGVWWDAAVETHSLPYVDRLDVHPERTDDGAVLHVRTTVVTGGPLEERITYSLRPAGASGRRTSGRMNRQQITADRPGTMTVEHAIELRDPSLWWPRDLEDQHRYTLRAKLGDSERSVTTGVCSVRRDGGRLRVNGEPMPVRGVNLLTDDPTDVERAVDLHANMVRAPAHVLSPAVYEACDEAGILVWQGLPLTGPGSFDVDRGRDIATRLVDTYGHHPSLGPVGIHDEPTDTFADGIGDGFLDGLRLRWRAWRAGYDRSPAERVAEALDGDVPGVPVVAGPGIDHDASAYYPGWDHGSAADIEGLLDRYPTGLLAAFGAGALADGADAGSDGTRTAAGFDAAKHDARADGGVAASQSYQADVLRTVAEAGRRRGVGVVASALRDTDAAGMGVYAADGTPKQARDTLARALQPVQAFLVDPAPGGTEAVVVNDASEPLSLTLAWEADEATGEQDLSVGATDRWTGTVDLPAADVVRLAVTVGSATVENTYRL
ncbi:MAG: hydrolase [Halobacteriales archaeon SW_9_67_25]|nr:MAG: hydrolase [Halobacteriales archaeon SW_9_67_25]